jgi:TPR repeat protein
MANIVVQNGLFALALYFSVFEDVVWLRYLTIAFIWFMLATYLAAVTSKDIDEFRKRKHNQLPKWLKYTLDLTFFSVLMFAEWYLTAAAYAASCICEGIALRPPAQIIENSTEELLSRKASEGDRSALVELQRLATEGSVESAFLLGRLYDAREESCPGVDFVAAAKWYENAASQGHAVAQYCLANMYDYGNGIAQDDAMARRWYAAAAKQGVRDAQMHLARMFQTGRGGPRSTSEAELWYGKAVELGDELAATNLGFMHLNKEVENPSDSEALRLFLLAAAKQDGLAHFALGMMHLEGRGVAFHIKQAALFFCIASLLLPPGSNRESAIAAKEQVFDKHPDYRREFEKLALSYVEEKSDRIPFVK